MKEGKTKSILFILFSLIVIIAAYFIIKSGNAEDKNTKSGSSDQAVENQNSDKSTEIPDENLTDSQKEGESAEEPESEKIVIYFFYGNGCPYCEKQKEFFNDLKKEMKNIEVKSYEVYGNKSNYQKFIDMAKAYNTEVEGVPMTFIGDKFWRGYADYIGEEIKTHLESCTNEICPDPATRL